MDTRARLADLEFVAARHGDFESDVQRDLSALSAALPSDYVEFLLRTGGGDFDVEVGVRCRVQPPQATDGRCLFGEFFHVGSGDSSLRVAWQRAVELMDSGLVPIASAAGGDLYCLRWREDVVDVVFWDHDSGDSFETATSFSDFIERMERIEDDESVDLDSIELRLDPDLFDE